MTEKVKEGLLPSIKEKLTLHQVENSFSTMTDAKNLPTSPLLVLAKNQGQAHGRFSRAFFTKENQGIYLSLKLPAGPLDPGQYTILTAVAFSLAIEKLTDKKPGIKWVNDLYLNGKKFAGILATGQLDTQGHLKEIIIGVGLNYDIPQSDFPKELQEKVTSLFPDKASFPKEVLIAEFVNQFFSLLKKPQEVLQEYKKRSFVLGKEVSFVENNIAYTGIPKDITETGSLVVETNLGTKILHSGEISLSTYPKDF